MIVLLSYLLLAACSKTVEKTGNFSCSTLKVYNWGVYIDPSVKSTFEKRYSVKVIYDEFASNEDMYTKLSGGESYDVLYPSDYMIERLIGENSLKPINKDLLLNYGSLLDEVKNWDYDPGNVYSIPYFWGNVGLLYNVNNVSKTDLENQGYNIMVNPKYAGKIYVYNSERDAFMMALKANGYSMNTSNITEIEVAYDWLLKQKATMKPIFVEDESIDNMVAGLKDIALMYSGDAVYVMSENEDMSFFIPNGGSNLWLDAMVIPTSSKCSDLAHAWIDFQLEYETASKNSLYVGYSSTVEDVYYDLAKPGAEYGDYPAYKVRVDNNNDEIFRYNAEIKKILADYWTRVLAS